MNDSVLLLTAVAAIASGTPLVFAALGEILTERSGILNLGVDGIMLVGAVSGFWATSQTGRLEFGVVAAVAAGAAVCLFHALPAITLRVNQIVSGLALAMLGTGIATFIGRTGTPPLVGQPPRASFRPLLSGGPADLPVVGPLLFGHDALVYLSWVLVAGVSWYLFHTRPGLELRAVGEDPGASDAAGVAVVRIRYVHTVLGGALAGLGGAYFSLALVPSWQDGITGGAGWIAIGLVIFASWRPWRLLLAAYLFGGVTRLNFTLQAYGVSVPSQFLAMLPFILTIVVLILLTGGRRGRFLGAPAALTRPYAREQR